MPGMPSSLRWWQCSQRFQPGQEQPQWRFCFPTAVEFNPKTDEIIVADSQRNRLQIYKKVRDYVDFQANL